MAEINLSARDIDLIGRVVDTEVPRSIARRNPAEYNRMVGAVVDTITNRLATGKYGRTVESVLNQHRAFSKITGPARLSPYGSVTKAPKATFTAQTAVDNHIKGRIAGVPSIIGGALDYANPKYSDRKNLRGWVQPMIDAGAKALGLGSATHYHGLAPGNFPAPPTDVFGPAGFAPHRGPPGPIDPSSPMRPDEANAAGPKGLFSVTPSYSAPLGEVTKGLGLAPASLRPDRPMPSGPIEGSYTPQSLPPDRPMPSGPVSVTASPSARAAFDAAAAGLPTDGLGTIAAPAAQPGLGAIAQEAAQPTYSAPSIPAPDAPSATTTIAPPGGTTDNTFPDAPPEPDESMFGPKTKRALAGLALAGPIGGLLGLASGALSGGGLGFGGPAGMASAGERFSAGSGLQGMSQGMYGPRGATGYSLSNPGAYSVSRGPNQGYDLTNQYGARTTYGPSGDVRANKDTNWSGVLSGIFGGESKKSKDKDKSSGRGLGGGPVGGYSGKGLY